MFVESRRFLDGDGGISALNELPKTLPDPAYRGLIRQAWTWSHNIWEHRHGWQAILEGQQRALGHFSSDPDHAALAAMVDPLAIYRGCCGHNQNGYSWSLDPQRAEYFASPSQGWTNAPRRFIASGKVKKTSVLAYITRRNEEEIVVLPASVTDLKFEDITVREKLTEGMMKKLGKAPK